MAAVLKIRIDNEATNSLVQLEEQLQHTAEVTAEQAVETRVLTEAQKEQIQVIHEHRAAWSQLISRVGPGLLGLTQSAGTLGLAYWQLRGRAQALSASKEVLQQVAIRAAASLTRIGGPVALLYTGYKGLTLILDNTGKSLQQSADATDAQREAFERLQIEAVTAGQSVQRYAKQQGVDLADLAVTTTTNLDRVSESAGNLGSALGRPFVEGARAAGDLADSLNPLPALWKAIDSAATSATDGIVARTDFAAESAGKLVDNLRAAAVAAGGGDGAQYVREAQQLRELEQLHEKLNRQREEEREHFDRLRTANAGLEAARRNATETARLQTLDSIAAIDGEMDKQRQAAGQRASAREFDEEAETAYSNRMAMLESRRTQLLQAEAAKRKDLLQQIREETETRERESLERRAANENDALRRSVTRYNEWAEDVRAAQKRANDFAHEFAANANNAILEDLIVRLDAEGDQEETLHRAKIQLIREETDQRIAAAETVEEREKAFYDGLLRLQREEQQHQRDVIRSEVEERKKAADEALAVETKKREALKKTLQDVGVADGQQMLQQIDPRRALMDQRGKAAADSARNRVLNDPRNAQLREDALTSVEASRRLERMQRQAAAAAEREARAGAFRDLRRGKVDPAELAAAQNETGQQMLQSLQKNGQLSGDTVQILGETLQAAANQQAVTDGLQRQLDQLKPIVRAMLTTSSQQRDRATKGGLN